MDPLDRAQVLLLCDLCQRAALQNHCELCQINLCKACVGEHLSDSSKRHNVVPYKHRKSTPNLNYPKCPNHTEKHCELYCKECDIPVCSTCISSGKHHGHEFKDILQKPSFMKEIFKTDLKELEKRILPTYEEISSDVYFEKVKLEKHYEKLTSAVTKQGEDWHREINIIVNKQKSEIDEMKTKHLAAVNKQEKEIKQITSEVKQSIADLKKLLDSNDVSLTSGYKSRNAEFRSLPPKINVSLPSYSTHQINTEQLRQMFGSLSGLSITTEEHGYTIMKTSEAVSYPPVKPLLDEPELITTIDTGYNALYSVTCLGEEEIWTSGNDEIMKLYNLKGKLLKSIQTKSGKISDVIAVTRSGDLVYTDPDTRTVNIVKNKQIQEVIRLQGWNPNSVCSTSSGDLLVTMDSDDEEQSKVVRYSGSTNKQTIQFDREGKPLYSCSSIFSKYISENRNLDICVADRGASAVVVVNQAGKLRFRYTGHPSTTKRSFYPVGITTDSQSQILIADCGNNCIHILDQDGHFLRYIDNCDLHYPYGLCVDTGDNLFVTEWNSGKVKKIKYMLNIVF
ncbi:tripartite motif-containing protein 5-like [Saccostrea cucullata]|uniref:tripartite motif-containing protein 5-like n=1 Tax=Saccostrea cuccullata TaxID=36930 RepID=UPI002ED0ECEB